MPPAAPQGLAACPHSKLSNGGATAAAAAATGRPAGHSLEHAAAPSSGQHRATRKTPAARAARQAPRERAPSPPEAYSLRRHPQTAGGPPARGRPLAARVQLPVPFSSQYGCRESE